MKKIAVFCPVKDESIFSPIWFNYYSRFFPKNDIYFLDFGSSDIKYDNVVKCDKNIYDAEELFDSIKSFHSELLKSYDYVIPTDVDEILFHESGLNNYINNLSADYVKSSGYELIHMPNEEPDIDLSKPILSQRKYWFRNPEYYDKTLITNKTLNWSIGLHRCYDQIDLLDPNLILLHLHKFDYNLCIKRHLEYSKKKWSDNTVNNNYNWHYRTDNETVIRNWFFSTEGNQIVEIPEKIKNLVGI